MAFAETRLMSSPQELLASQPLEAVVAEVTGLTDQDLIAEILAHLNK